MTLRHPSHQLVQNACATVGQQQAPAVVQRTFAGVRARSVQLADRVDQVVTPERARHQPAQRTEQQFVDQRRRTQFREQRAVEQGATGDVRPAFVVTRQQFLGDAAAIVVGQQVHRLDDAQVLEQCLLQVGLLDQAVAVIERLGRIAEAQHVARHHAKALRQGCPQVVPVPTGGRKSVQQQQGRALPCCPITNALAPKGETAPTGTPDAQWNLGQRHRNSPAGQVMTVSMKMYDKAAFIALHLGTCMCSLCRGPV